MSERSLEGWASAGVFYCSVCGESFEVEGLQDALDGLCAVHYEEMEEQYA